MYEKNVYPFSTFSTSNGFDTWQTLTKPKETA